MNATLTFFLAIIYLPILFFLIHWSVFRQRKKKKYSPFTEKFLRSPGYTLAQKFEEQMDRVVEAALGLVIVPAFFIFAIGSVSDLSKAVLSLVVLVAILVLARQFLSRSEQAAKTRLGLDGEIYTGQELNFLMRLGAYVFHDIPYNYGNIDHVIVSQGGVFVVETKTFRKPSDESGKRNSRVSSIDGALRFPGFATSNPINQVLLHADSMRTYLEVKTGTRLPVIPVIALPGWFVDKNDNSNLLVINPKRGKALRSYVTKSVISNDQVEMISTFIEEIARSVQASAEKFDPDANVKFNLLLERKAEERRIE